ncbi:MAG: hypothetical protein ACFFDN_14020 [Candidatus Hodarchaeota archaeon]
MPERFRDEEEQRTWNRNFEKRFADVLRHTFGHTIQLDNSMSAADINTLIANQHKMIPHGHELIFEFQNGTYNLTEAIVVPMFYGRQLTFTSVAGTTTLHTTQPVFLDFVSYECNGIEIYDNWNFLKIIDLKIRVKTNVQDNNAIYPIHSNYVQIQGCYLQGNSRNFGAGAFYERGSNGAVQTTYVELQRAGIYAFRGSEIYSTVNDDIPGNPPDYGLYANDGTIKKATAGTQPAGNTANEFTTNGGVIE